MCNLRCCYTFCTGVTLFASFRSPEAALLFGQHQESRPLAHLWPGPTPEVRESRTSRHSAHAQSQVWQIWLVLVSIFCVYKAIQNRNVGGPGQRWGQRSWFLVLTKRNAASGDKNVFALVLHLNCTALSQSESRNVFMCVICLETLRHLRSRDRYYTKRQLSVASRRTGTVQCKDCKPDCCPEMISSLFKKFYTILYCWFDSVTFCNWPSPEDSFVLISFLSSASATANTFLQGWFNPGCV